MLNRVLVSILKGSILSSHFYNKKITYIQKVAYKIISIVIIIDSNCMSYKYEMMLVS